MDKIVVWVRNCSLYSPDRWDGAAIVFDYNLLVDSDQLLDDSFVDNLGPYLASKMVVTLSNAESFATREDDSW